MKFIWNDGGRTASGFVGSTGDCVTRSIAIATGTAYRDIYDSLSDLGDKTARHGISSSIIRKYLSDRGWTETKSRFRPTTDLPRGVVLVEFDPAGRQRSGHVSCLIDHTIYDTWNPFDDPKFEIVAYWTCSRLASDTTLPNVMPESSPVTERAVRRQDEYEKIIRRVKALQRTAENNAATEGEIDNALRAMQAIMLEHNLSRSDIVDDDDVSRVGYTRMACPLNGAKACQWESSLAHYVTQEIFSLVQFYQDRKGHRTFFWFFGPVDDVQHAIELFRELLLTIFTAARVKYGGHSRGSGASYAEGYVRGLPKANSDEPVADAPLSQNALMLSRALAVHSAANEWLDIECGIKLYCYGRSSGRGHFDPSAHGEGKRDGAQHHHNGPGTRKQISYQPSALPRKS